MTVSVPSLFELEALERKLKDHERRLMRIEEELDRKISVIEERPEA